MLNLSYPIVRYNTIVSKLIHGLPPALLSTTAVSRYCKVPVNHSAPIHSHVTSGAPIFQDYASILVLSKGQLIPASENLGGRKVRFYLLNLKW